MFLHENYGTLSTFFNLIGSFGVLRELCSDSVVTVGSRAQVLCRFFTRRSGNLTVRWECFASFARLVSLLELELVCTTSESTCASDLLA